MTNTENTQTQNLTSNQTPTGSATGKIALVTGANKGIGKEIARGLAQLGFTVLLAARDAERGLTAAAELAADGHVAFQQLDVTDPASIDAAVKNIEQRHGRLDVLVNNAGIGVAYAPASQTSTDAMRTVFETNVFSIVGVTNAMLPLLRNAEAARIVNVSSVRGSLTHPDALTWNPSMSYSTSKTAVNALTVHYALELADTPIKVNAVTPGYVATDLNAFQGNRTPAEGARVALKYATLDADGPSGGLFDEEGVIPW